VLRKGLTAAAVAALLLGTSVTASAHDVLSTAGSAKAKPAAALVSNGSWTVYHHDNAHTGYDSTQPAASGAAAGWTSPVLNGQIYGEPLVYNGLVYVATLQNVVYALNQSDGTVVWSKTLPAPQTSGWQCGNINPTGILSTGVIDPIGGRLYLVPFLSDFGAYYLYAFNLFDGTILMTTQILPSGFDWTIQQQRGAIALSVDRSHVYVPFGGRIGDCGPYRGWVIGVPTNGANIDEIYETPSQAEGIWAAGGVVIDDTTSNVFFATGNAIPCSGAVNSDSVIRTAPTLGAATSFFQPLDWSTHWCGPDLDLGSVSPVLISPSLMFTTGKYGQGFLLDPTNLGGTNGQLYPSPTGYTGVDVCVGNNGDASFGSVSYANGRLYLTCDGNGIVSLTVNTSTPSFSSCDTSCTASGTWHAPVGTVGPPIIAGGAVWAVSTSGAGLYGFDTSTGAQIYHSASFSANRFSTPSEAGGQIFVGAGTQVKSFNMLSGCTSVSLSAAPLNSTTAGNTVVVTANATGPSCVNPQYRFWLRTQTGPWTMQQDYSTTNTWNWTSTTLAGNYYIGVHARNGTSTVPFEALNSIFYTITPTVCTGVTITPSPGPSQVAGTPVTFTAVATGCPNSRYAFWFRTTTSAWQLIQPYSATNTFNWNTSGALGGTYYFGVWAKDASSTTSTFDINASTAFAVDPASCTSVGVSAAPPTAAHSSLTQVTFTAVASGCTHASPLYEFWYFNGASWYVVRGWSTTASWVWNTSAPAGNYTFGVWVRDAASPGNNDGGSMGRYDTYAPISYSLT
jgi:outer membrane protein assembly factor BamB